jgi:uncharacterized membrane protein
MLRNRMMLLLTIIALLGGQMSTLALAQEPQPLPTPSQSLSLFTTYPAQVVQLGETVTMGLTLRTTGSSPLIVRLDTREVPEGWTVTFRGGGRIVQSAYVEPGKDTSVDLRIEQPQGVTAGTYRFVAIARSQNPNLEATLPIELTVKEKLPPKLSLSVDLPTIKGSPTTIFRWDTTLKNDGDEDLTVNLESEAPPQFRVSFKLSGQEVTSLPLKARESKRISFEADPLGEAQAGQYPFTFRALGGEAEASLNLTAEVTGQPSLTVTAPDGRLSGQAYAGRETPLKVIVQNTGSASAYNVQLSASGPSGWAFTANPKEIPEIPAGQQVEATINIRPAEKAVAGDYMITVRASPEGGSSKSAEFRIMVLTSTLWGIVGVALIAIAVGVVGLAVARFGRR